MTALTDRPAPAAAPAPAGTDPPPPVRRVRELIAAVALTALAFTQQPGLVVGDTKADLVADPGGFLRRALSAWDPQQAFGQLPNQSYGYLWPMGPFFWLGDALGLPPWVVQRGWWSLLLVVGFAGALRLATALGIGTPATRLVAAVAYAVSPRVLSVLGSISVEAWPAAVLPWVLLPLVLGGRGRLPPRRAAALSGIAVACLGGVNAAATLAVLPLPALYLATRPRGVRGRLAAWWAPVVLLATSWWLLPLLVLGRYAYPFLDLIEDADVTTSVTTLTNTLRGSSHWLGFLVVHGGPRWPAGFDLAVSPLPVLATAGIAAAGLAGLLLPGLADRRWLLGGVLLGAVLIAVGHAGTLTSPLAPAVQDLLDGPLAPLRNVHKADPLLRLPLALGVAHLLAAAARARWRRLPVLAVAAVVALLAGTAAPAWGGRLAPAGGYERTPAYWREVAAWLSARAAVDGGGRALLVPSSNFADYGWGRPQDEPLQALARSPWAVRDAVPLGAPGTTRLLDGLDARLATGQPSAAYAPVLARAGVRYVVVRNDVDVPQSGAERPGVVRAALDGSPGIWRVAAFGPRVRTAYVPGEPVTGGAGRPSSVEVFQVGPAPQRVAAYPRAGAVALSGGPEGVLPLADAGLLDGRAVIAAADLPGVGGVDAAGAAGAVDAVVGTDTLRRRTHNAGADPGRRYSPTLPAQEERQRADVTPYAGPTRESVAVLDGVAGVAASSSAADPFAVAYRGPDRRPAAAFDRDPATAWVSDAGPGGAGEWVEVRLSAPASPAWVEVTPLDDPAVGPRVTRLEVRTDAGAVTEEVRAGARSVRVELPPGTTTRVRVTASEVAGAGAVGFSEVVVDDVEVTEAVALPTDAIALAFAGLPWTVLAQRPDGRRGDCVRERSSWVCVGGLAAAGEEVGPLERRFGSLSPARVTIRATVRPRPGAGLDALLDRSRGYLALASSALTVHPAARAGAAYDGDWATAWLPAGDDPAPQLRLDLGSTVRLDGLRLTGTRAEYAGVARVVLRTADGQRRELPAAPGMTVPFAPVRTREVTLTFERAADADGVLAPVVVRDLALAGAPRRRTGPVEAACGQGPGVAVDGEGRRVSVRAAAADLLTLAPVPATVCGGPVAIGAGGHRLTTARTAAFEVASVALTGGRAPAEPPVSRPVAVQRWEPESRRLRVAAGDAAYLTLAEGFNAGWRATAGGRELVPVRLDGWRQGWVLPAGGETTVEVSYLPGRRHRAGLLIGLAAALLVVALAAVPARRIPPGTGPPGAGPPGAGPPGAGPPGREPAGGGLSGSGPDGAGPGGADTRVAVAGTVGGAAGVRRWRSRVVAAVAAGGVAVLLAGPVGLLAAAAALLLPARHRAPAAGGALALAGLVLGLAPTWGVQPALTQLLALAALALVAATLVGEPEQGPLDQHP